MINPKMVISALMLCGIVLAAELKYSSADDLLLNLETENNQYEYVIDEPIKLRVTFVNDSSEPVNLIGIEHLGNNMRFMYYEIETPNNRIELRKSQFILYNYEPNRNYSGESLLPGESLCVYLYPRYSKPLDYKIDYPSAKTFSMPGEHTLRVVYSVPKVYEKLWRGTDGLLYSNPINITLKQPTNEETELLEAYWSGDMVSEYGDMVTGVEYNHNLLNNMVKRYPNNNMIKYIYLALGRSLTNPHNKSNSDSDITEGIQYLNLLKSSYPNFRSVEVNKHIAASYYALGELDKANEIYSETLKKNPELIDEYDFMSHYIAAKYDNRTIIFKWRENRSKGIKDIENMTIE